jgi:hypothetical protein
MKQVLISTTSADWPGVEIEYPIPVRLFVDTLHGLEPNEKSFKILWIKEVEDISHFAEQALENAHHFDAIITYHQGILDKCKHAFFMAFGTAWVWDYKESTEKIFQVSHLTGNKEYTYGHKLRKELYTRQFEIKIPTDFYISSHSNIPNLYSNKILGATKTPMFDSMFHLCIENTTQRNCFTEKLIDCLITKTIPIYYGCENISEYFDIESFYIVNTAEEAIKLCNTLTPDDYYSKQDTVQKNLLLAKPYATLLDRFSETVEHILTTSKPK